MTESAALIDPTVETCADFRAGLRRSPLPNNGASIDAEMNYRLGQIMDRRSLTALFQPIVNLDRGVIGAYEGLIRGPSNSPLHSPLQLFRTAALCNRSVEVEHLCRRVTLESFARLGLPGHLFLNVSPDCLLQPTARYGETLSTVHQLGIDPQRVVIELTEHQPAYDYDLLREAVRHYRSMGFRIAIDDLGEGFSSLRLWSELRPEFVKIDMHFIQGCDNDPVKKQFLRSIQEIARNSASQVIAEGIETSGELDCIRDIGIALGQGYYFARPCASPAVALSGESAKSFVPRHRMAGALPKAPTAGNLMRAITPVLPSAIIDDAFAIFDRDPTLQSLPVVEQGIPRGIISRHSLIDRLARPFRRELFGRKPCRLFMDSSPLLVESKTPLHELGRMVADADQHHLVDGFIVVEDGRYRGMGTGQDLMREITRQQLMAAQQANPLTGLPGNEPINALLATWIEGDEPFCAAYCDLDHFKPFNDVFGFARGDDAIRLLGRILVDQAVPARDFVGHIGGDDFMVLFRSQDWERRCRNALTLFGEAMTDLFTPEDFDRGGYLGEDRRGISALVPLLSLSIGVVAAVPGQFSSHYQIASAAAVAKKEAKKIAGNSLFVERREL